MASLTLFSSYHEPLVPDEPEEVYEYSDYRMAGAIAVPFLVLAQDGSVRSEYLIAEVEFAESDPDLSLP